MKQLMLVAMLLLAQAAYGAGEIARAFPGTKKLELITFKGGIGAMPISVYYRPALATVLKQRRFAGSEGYEAEGIYVVRALRTKLSPDSSAEYLIDFEAGGSGDPTFHVSTASSGGTDHVGVTFGTTLIIPGNGFMYVAGHTNNMFDQRKKFRIADGQLIEVGQPYYYVGLTSKVKKELVLYSSAEAPNEVIARLPPGSEITVLISRDNEYLGRTSFGLTGWFSVPAEQTATVVEGLYFRGD